MNKINRIRKYHAAIFGLFLFVLTCVFQACSRDEPYESFTFVQMADPQLGMAGYQHDSLNLVQAVRQINDMNPDFVIICGDLVHRASDTSFNDFRKIISRLEAPCYLVAGNHDVENVPTLESLSYYRQHLSSDYYSFTHKGYNFIVVNSNLWTAQVAGGSEKQDLWLKETVMKMAAGGKPLIVAAHHPLFLADPEEEADYFSVPPGKRAELMDLFSECDWKGYLSGHTHKMFINDYQGVQMVSCEATSVNFDSSSPGFRIWNAAMDTLIHEFVPLDGF